jgi:sugar (pentulose or hexulose) kinase
VTDETFRAAIADGRTTLGIELGSTRIKAVLIDEHHAPIAAGSHDWENRYEDGLWTYRLDDVWTGVAAAYRMLADAVEATHDITLERVGAIGISAMMHGYLAFDRDGRLLVPFRTWRNTTTSRAAAALTELFGFNVPLRWSIAHLDQAILDGEPHVPAIDHLTTLAGYVHLRLTGEQVLGAGDASGMFPLDETGGYDPRMVDRFDARLASAGLRLRLLDLLPEVRPAGAEAGQLTEAGALLLDPGGRLRAGIPLCPPEGDAGTGMVATNSVAERTGNVSAGTSVFAMVVLERALTAVHPEVDVVTTPAGRPVAMVHSNNCTSDLDAWIRLFGEVAEALGRPVDRSTLYQTLSVAALAGEADGGGLLAYNTLSGEPITDLIEGRPMLIGTPDARFTLPNLMRTHLFAALAALRIGMDVLLEQERVQIDELFGHGGFFKVPDVGQRMMAAAMGVPVSVMQTAGEGGAWGIALLAAYRLHRMGGGGRTLDAWLDGIVFPGASIATVQPDPRDVAGFTSFLGRYRAGLAVERAAIAAT